MSICRICNIMSDDLPDPKPARRFGKRHIFGATLLLLVALLGAVWWQRIEIADHFVKRQLEKYGVRATYEIEHIGFRTQRLRNVVVGDPARPDLTAKRVEIDIVIGFSQPRLGAVRANGIRLRGRVRDNQLSLGELDKFRDPKSKEPLRLPDLRIDLRDAIASLSTPWGGVGIAAEGSGHLRNSFDGRLWVRSPLMSGAGCSAQRLRYDGKLRIRNARPEFDGPLSAARADCPAYRLAVVAPAIAGKVQLTESFDRWVGDVALAAKSLGAGANSGLGLAARLDFDGGMQRTRYRLDLDRLAMRVDGLAIRQLSGSAEGSVAAGSAGLQFAARGSAALDGASVAPSMLPDTASLVRGTSATPVGPVVARLAPALKAAAAAFDATLGFDLAMRPDGNIVRFDKLFVRSRSGAILEQQGSFALASGRPDNVTLRLRGGDLPAGQLQLRAQGSGWAGTLAIQPYNAKGGSISIPTLAFSGGGNRPWRFTGQASMTGPLLGGQISGLSLPVSGTIASGVLSMNAACTDIRYQGLTTGALRLPAGRLRACPQRGSILQVGGRRTVFALTIPSLAVAGALGSAPMRASGRAIAFDLDRGFNASDVAVDLGRSDSMTRFTVTRLDGRLTGKGVAGSLQGGAGQIGNVPLLIGDTQGEWRWHDGVLGLDATLFVSDAAEVDRFNPLRVPNFQLTLADNKIVAIGDLAEPESGVTVANAQIQHNLGNSVGSALLSVDGLQFNDKLQPEQITPLTLGSIANVKGRIVGDGRIDWNGETVRSSGRFSVQATDLAAAFGPVDGLNTDIVFTDLLGMVTAPGQVARIASLNPGIPALDGVIRYQLLPDQKVKIEEGRWPFYGGELILEPTVLDFDVEAKRQLTFRLVGLDAEKFLAGYDIENLRVSGVFDGTLPMVFDQEGGRIVGGWLVSRPGGGELSYLGEISYKDMGVMANFAFEALRSIRFEEMQIGVDGNLGGEVVTEVRFRGLQQGSLAKRNYITKQLAKLPLEFNVRIAAEFLSLIANIRSIYDGDFAAERFGSQVLPVAPITGEESKANEPK